MSLHFDESNPEFFEDVPNNDSDYITVQNNNGQQPTSALTPTATLLQHERIKPNEAPAPQYINANTEVSTPRISRSFDSSQNQILKIELEIVIKLQNDQNQQRTKHVHSSTLLKNQTVNRMNPYRKPTEQNNFRINYSSVEAPQLNKGSAVYMQPNEDLNETFNSGYDN